MFRLYDTDGNGVLDTNVSKELSLSINADGHYARAATRACNVVLQCRLY